MSHDSRQIRILGNNHGFGLIAAIFVVVILAVFGLLVARFTGTGAVSSAEDYLWAQAYYAVQSAAQLKILCRDNGGTWGGGVNCDAGIYADPSIATFDTSPVNDNFGGAGNPSVLRINASRGAISRVLVVKYIL